ncbi:sensor histidine kinase [Marinobacterium nitratireducens]|uniref:histidine kinase n=1 Tax=Marinobacterium nitratireducens TaxID=518897 RepID=A0A918DW93_9GAMM|nr:sensor histidine kinase [Marinobacterium nitratireducens]GGO84458.1 sensor histidine kinase [Marinobacterium nitratireducens]
MTRANPSIRRQLLWMTLLVLIVINGFVAWSANLYANRAARLSYDRLLLGSVLQIAENINSLDGNIVIDLPRSAFETLAMAPSDRAFYSIIGPDQHVLSGYTDLPDIPFDDLDQVRDQGGQITPFFYNGVYRGEEVRFLGVNKQLIDSNSSSDIYIVVGQTLSARQELAKETNWFVLRFVMLFFAVTLLLLMFGIWRVLRPLQRLRKAIDERSALELKPLILPVPKEITPLVNAINRSNTQLNSTLERLKRFTSEAAHQIRTPLAGLSSQAQNALDEKDETQRQQQLSHIVECSNLLRETVNQLLNQATLAHRFQSQPLKSISLDRLTKEVCRDLVVWALQKGVEIEYSGKVEVEIDGDDFALKQMIRNIIENAVNYSSRQSVVEVSLHVEHGKSRDEVVLRVKDQGIGVSDEEKQHIFERFYRSPNSQQPGTGIGLAIAKEVAEHHHASFRLRDNTPRGLIVEVVFPPVEVTAS